MPSNPCEVRTGQKPVGEEYLRTFEAQTSEECFDGCRNDSACAGAIFFLTDLPFGGPQPTCEHIAEYSGVTDQDGTEPSGYEFYVCQGWFLVKADLFASFLEKTRK